MSTTASAGSQPVATGVDEARLAGLRRWNLALTVLHAAQAVAVLLLAGSFAITVTSSFPAGPPGTAVPAPEPLVDVDVGGAIAVFLGLAALDHLVTATALRRRYEEGLRRGINRFRWLEYSLSATIMVLLICAYTGITGLSALIGIAGANVAMILFGWLQELVNPPGRARTTMLPFWFGCVAGAAPWVAITANIVGADQIPGFVYGIFFSLFVFFMSFALNQWLQYRQIGRWRSYAYGEKAYLVLSLVAKSALAWQIFAGSLAT
ncbi:heliorhodopsin HeR [Trujillonella humicola]|uniref:heliorhodopsin HeR n=1 Tax=Trujillonella humicola TaxID=3383699 RepID=UPI003905FFC0